MNHTHAVKRMRSAIAPVISAGVMTANIIWNAEKSSGGIESAEPGRHDSSDVLHATAKSKLPMRLAGAAEGERVAARRPRGR